MSLLQRHKRQNILILISFLFISSCQSDPAGFRAPNTALTSLKVVLLPFSNLTTTPDAGKSVTAIFLSDLLVRQPFSVVPLPKEEVLEVPLSTSGYSISPERRSRLKILSGADAALTGVVSEFDYQVGGSTRPVVGLSWMLISLRTGRVLWAENASRMGSCFWTCRGTVSGLTRDLIDEKVRGLTKE